MEVERADPLALPASSPPLPVRLPVPRPRAPRLAPFLARALAAATLVVAPAAAQPGGAGGKGRASAPIPFTPAAAPAGMKVTPSVFRRFSDRVVKIQVVETESAAKAVIGSGFYAGAAGDIVTNYHVISKLVHAPERYRIELVDAAGASRPVTLQAIDVIHDLAIARGAAPSPTHFALEQGQAAVAHGDRLYSLGHPGDLSLSIVEGTYNGPLQYTLYPKIHFTGSLNTGMSGGPAIDEAGRVVGVNVASAGNQVSFLIPVDRAISLWATVRAPGFRPPSDFLSAVGQQIRAYQNEYLATLFAGDVPTVTLGRYTLPTEPARYFKCWGDATRDTELPYEVVSHRCSTDDQLYISGEQSSGIVEIEHRLISSRTLNALRFSALYTWQFDADGKDVHGVEEEVTNFQCEARNVRTDAATLRTALCVRGYRKLPGLYDAVLRAAVLGASDEGVVTILKLSGVSFENVQQVARWYLERIAWKTK